MGFDIADGNGMGSVAADSSFSRATTSDTHGPRTDYLRTVAETAAARSSGASGASTRSFLGAFGASGASCASGASSRRRSRHRRSFFGMGPATCERRHRAGSAECAEEADQCYACSV
jgi:hypothetical protein